MIYIFKGMIYLEKEKIIHLNIKPENILITWNNIYKISDYGIIN